MKLHSPYVCDICSHPKQESNHWWLHPQEYHKFTLLHWDDERANEDGIKHICSESCSSKALSKWMAKASALSASVSHQERSVVDAGMES